MEMVCQALSGVQNLPSNVAISFDPTKRLAQKEAAGDDGGACLLTIARNKQRGEGRRCPARPAFSWIISLPGRRMPPATVRWQPGGVREKVAAFR